MNNEESLEYLRNYFDDDIGDPGVDYLRSSKEYLLNWFREQANIGVDVNRE